MFVIIIYIIFNILNHNGNWVYRHLKSNWKSFEKRWIFGGDFGDGQEYHGILLEDMYADISNRPHF